MEIQRLEDLVPGNKPETIGVCPICNKPIDESAHHNHLLPHMIGKDPVHEDCYYDALSEL